MEEGLIMERLAGRLRRGDGRGSTIFFFGLLGAGALLAIGLALIASGLDVPLARMAIAAVPPDTPLFQLLTYLSGTPEAKGMIPAAALFWVLFTRLEDSIAVRWARTLAVLGTGLAAIVLGRLFANVMPFRPRPLASPEVMGAHVQTSPFLADFSSMPSDHAMIFVALAVAAFFVSRALGAVLLAHAVLLVSLPRVLLGIHYPSDVLVGGALGAMVALIVAPRLRGWFATWLARHPRLCRRPDLMVPLLFVVAFQFATMFDSLRLAARMAVAAFE